MTTGTTRLICWTNTFPGGPRADLATTETTTKCDAGERTLARRSQPFGDTDRMPTALLDGKKLPAQLQAEIAAATAGLIAERGLRPGLATVLIGADPASPGYVRSKRKACAAAGMLSFHHELPATVDQGEVLDLVARLNDDPAVHGILMQLPLPKQLDEAALIRAVSPAKDVDVFHPE